MSVKSDPILSFAVSIIPLVIGSLYLAQGIVHKAAACEVPLAVYSVTQGSLVLAATLFSLASSFGLMVNSESSSQNIEVQKLLVLGTTLLLWTAIVGVSIWGTVLAFSNNLWVRERDAVASGAPVPCLLDLYFPLAYVLIVYWGSLAFIATMILCLVGCCCILCPGGGTTVAELFAGLVHNLCFSSSAKKNEEKGSAEEAEPLRGAGAGARAEEAAVLVKSSAAASGSGGHGGASASARASADAV